MKLVITCSLLLLSGSAQAQEIILDSAAVVELRASTKNYTNSEVQDLAAAISRTGLSRERSLRYAEYFVRYGRETGTEPRLLAAIAFHESEWSTSAYNSHGGSHGLMQVVPSGWLRSFAGHCGSRATRLALRDPRISICYGAYIFREFRRMGGGSVSRGLRGYNSGPRFLRNGYDRKVWRAYGRLGRV